VSDGRVIRNAVAQLAARQWRSFATPDLHEAVAEILALRRTELPPCMLNLGRAGARGISSFCQGVQSNAIAIGIDNMRKKPHAGRQFLRGQGNVSACRLYTPERRRQTRRSI
jgi:hypothetical protein